MPEPVVSVTPPARNVRPNESRFISGICTRYLLLTSVPSVASSESSSTGIACTVILVEARRGVQRRVERGFLVHRQNDVVLLHRSETRRLDQHLVVSLEASAPEAVRALPSLDSYCARHWSRHL